MRIPNFKDMSNSIKKINIGEHGILYALILMWLILFATNDSFRGLDIYVSILRESAFVGVAAIGMTFCIISGNFDLSVGYMMTFVGLITLSIVGKVGLFPALIIAIIIGAACGTVNGLLISKVRIPAFIATLAMMNVYSALGRLYSDAKSIQFQEPWFTVLGNGDILGVPIPFIVFIIAAIIGTLILRRMPLGRYILALGNSEKASIISGVNVSKIKTIIFAIVGAYTAVSAVLIGSRLWSINPDTKKGFEFQVIAAVVLGGTSLAGGKGSIFNTLIASIFFSSIYTALNMFHVESFKQNVIQGLILLIAFSISGIKELMKEKLKKYKNKKIYKQTIQA